VEHESTEWLRGPETEDEIDEVEAFYSRCGIPGYIGSMDAVHVAWDRCPAAWTASYTGKEGYPTVAFNVCCHHNKKIFSVSGPHCGARNDKCVVKYDDMISDLKLKDRYRALRRTLLNGQDIEGAYVVFTACSPI